MKLLAKKKKYDFTDSDVIALFLPEEYEKDLDNLLIADLIFIKDRIDLSYFKGKLSESIYLPFKDYPNIIIIGIGKKNDITNESLKNCASEIIKICKKGKIDSINIVLPEIEGIDELRITSSLAEGLYLSGYAFDKYKSKKDDENGLLLKTVNFYSDEVKKTSTLLKEIEITSENTILCRELVNETSEKANPLAIAKNAKSLSKIEGITCKVYGKKEIEKMKMGLLLAVSQGSAIPPQLVELTYRGNPKSKKKTVIVGKGITFDSGGVNLKPSGHIEDMRSDMAGAAASLYTVKAAAELKLKKNVTAVIPLCENLLSRDSYRPGDIFIAYNGKSVEIGNTDAEGRLILADALAYSVDKLKPDYLIDIATLTGACRVCFGDFVAGLLSNDGKLAELIFNAGEATGDRVWRMPLYREYDESLKSDIADIKNVSSGRSAGTIVGAVFLKNFIDNAKWAHIDIAGTSWFSKQIGYRSKYATGFGVRLFVEFLRGLDD